MRDAGLVAGRNVARQPGDQVVHRLDDVGLRALVLFGPASDLALEVVAGLAEVAEPDRRVVDAMQPCQDVVHLVVDGGALGAVDSGNLRIA